MRYTCGSFCDSAGRFRFYPPVVCRKGFVSGDQQESSSLGTEKIVQMISVVERKQASSQIYAFDDEMSPLTGCSKALVWIVFGAIVGCESPVERAKMSRNSASPPSIFDDNLACSFCQQSMQNLDAYGHHCHVAWDQVTNSNHPGDGSPALPWHHHPVSGRPHPCRGPDRGRPLS